MNGYNDFLGWVLLAFAWILSVWCAWFIGERRAERAEEITDWLCNEFEQVLQENDVPYEITRWIRQGK